MDQKAQHRVASSVIDEPGPTAVEQWALCAIFWRARPDLESFGRICFLCLQDVYLNCICQGTKLDKFLISGPLFDTVLFVLPFVSGSMDADFLGKADYVEQTPLAACARGVE